MLFGHCQLGIIHFRKEIVRFCANIGPRTHTQVVGKIPQTQGVIWTVTDDIMKERFNFSNEFIVVQPLGLKGERTA
jgi:hypothetical protein